jgi:MFS family permease
MLLATTLVGRFGYRLRKEWASSYGLVLAGLGFVGLGLITQGYRILPQPLLLLYPHAALSLTTSVMGISFLLGLSMSAVSILGQTVLQEESPPDVRGRVFALQFMLNNLIGIPPMLTVGGLADWVGIPQVMLALGVAVLVAAVVSIYFALTPTRRDSLKRSVRGVASAVRHPREWYARQAWIAQTEGALRRAGRWCCQVWHAACRSVHSIGSRLRAGLRAVASDPNRVQPPPASEDDRHVEEPAGSAPGQHPEDRRD